MDQKKVDFICLVLVISIVIGLPAGIWIYNNHLWQNRIPAGAKEFVLTGHRETGWILGEVRAHDIARIGGEPRGYKKPVIHVSQGDRVVFRLKSSDVVHGFSLKDFGIFINEGVQPGKVRLVSFVVDKAGRFTFSCNAVCGENHPDMQGTLVVQI
ncbi:MAG: hypothetical protein H8E81_04320 [Deltaproteobacteria bacterium]|nr:hypothetical protein [Deltaproteobacteria bacterium]